MPPAPRKVGSPEEADSPAPRSARIRVDLFRCCWKLSRSLGGTTLGLAAEEAILRMIVGSVTVVVVVFFADWACEEEEDKNPAVSCVRCLSDRQKWGPGSVCGEGEAAAVVAPARYVRLPHHRPSAHQLGKPMPLPPKLNSPEPTSANDHDFCDKMAATCCTRAIQVRCCETGREGTAQSRRHEGLCCRCCARR